MMRFALAAALVATLSGCTEVHHHYHRGYSKSEVRSYTHRVAHRRPVKRYREARLPLPPPRPFRPLAVAPDATGCLPVVRVVGPDAWTERGALIKARRAWSSQVRFDAGEKWGQLERARDISVECSRASTNESTVGKMGKAVAGPLAVRDRCVVSARPCGG